MNLIEQLSSQGLLGLLLAISITANIYLFLKLQELWYKRLEDKDRQTEDFKELSTKIEHPLTEQASAFRLLTEVIKENIAKIGERKL